MEMIALNDKSNWERIIMLQSMNSKFRKLLNKTYLEKTNEQIYTEM